MAITPQTYQHLADLIHHFWAVIDEQTDTPGADLFTPTGALVIESFRATGRAELGRYFDGRRELSRTKNRTTRHLCTNLRLLEGGEQPRLQTTITVFSGYGARPIALTAPSTLCDFVFDCEATDGGWRFSKVEGWRVFAGDDTPDLNRAQADVSGAGA